MIWAYQFSMLVSLSFPLLILLKFSLKQLLHVPTITKNLLSVSKFAHDNDVFFEIHSHSYLVKDQTSKTVLLEGKFKNGLYVFDHT